MKKRFETETELAGLIIEYLTDLRWEIYQEVQIVANGPCADIVATQGPLIWVIETKLNFGLNVIGQAYEWLNLAHLVSVATPYTRRDKMARLVCREFGIGHLYADGYRVSEGLAPRLHRTARIARLRNALIPERKTYAQAGNASGDRLTAFGITCMRVQDFVRVNPGCTVKELVDGIKTHYATPSSARNSLAHWIGNGKVMGVRMDWKSGKARIWPEETTGHGD